MELDERNAARLARIAAARSAGVAPRSIDLLSDIPLNGDSAIEAECLALLLKGEKRAALIRATYISTHIRQKAMIERILS